MVPTSSLRQGAVLVVALILVLSAFGGVAVAQTGPAGTIVVEQGQTSSGISTMAGTVIVRGTVNGNVNALAGDVVVERTGTVTGNVEGAAGSLRIDGHVGGNVNFAGGSVAFGPASVVDGSVNVGAGTAIFAGTVAGDVRAGADRITLAPSADIGGEFRYDGTLDRQAGSAVAGGVVNDPSIGRGPTAGGWRPFSLSLPGWLDTVYGFLANLVLGALLLLLFPRFSQGVADTVESRPLGSGGWGIVGLLLTPIVLLVVLITIIGIPIALIGFLLYALAVWIGLVYGEFATGRYLLERADVDNRWYALVAGLLLFSLLGLIPILGGVASFLALLVGLGALGISLRRRYDERRDRRTGAAATDVPPGEPTESGDEGTSPAA